MLPAVLVVMTCIPAGSHHLGHHALVHWSGCRYYKFGPWVQKLLIRATWASSTVRKISYRQAKVWKLKSHMFIPTQSDTTCAKLSTADKLLSLKFNYLSLKFLSRMASVFQSLLQVLSLNPTAAPDNTGGSGGGSAMGLHTPHQQKRVSRSPHRKKNIFKLNVAWLQCPFFHGYFLTTILETSHLLQGRAP